MLKLLLVDDDESSTQLFRLFLERVTPNVRLEVLHDGRKAMEYLSGKGQYSDRARFPIPDLVVLDLIMPGISGFDVLDWRLGLPEIRAIPFVALSGSLKEQDKQDALAKGASRYFWKPVDVSHLKQTIAEIVEFGKQQTNSRC